MSATLQAPAPYEDAPLTPGKDIFTLDNRRLGRVRDVTDSHFKVDVRFRRDYWLSRERIAYIDDRCVGMRFRSDELELYRLTSPRDEGFGWREFTATHPMAGDGVSDRNWRSPSPH